MIEEKSLMLIQIFLAFHFHFSHFIKSYGDIKVRHFLTKKERTRLKVKGPKDEREKILLKADIFNK